MTAETRVQIEVVKNRDYLGGIYKGTAMITDGRYIVYIPEKDAIINIPKLRNLSEDGMKRFSPEELMAKNETGVNYKKGIDSQFRTCKVFSMRRRWRVIHTRQVLQDV